MQVNPPVPEYSAKCVSSSRRSTVSDEADVMFHSFGPAESNDRSLAVTPHTNHTCLYRRFL